jgi:ribosomal protein S18 acetylase RimI-like enzyme
LRARADEEAAHRVMLGMGVHRNARRQGLGLRLIGQAEAWARARGFAWIDLEVLSVNQAAIALYRQAGFEQTGEVQDMFRIDGEPHAYTAMSKRLA